MSKPTTKAIRSRLEQRGVKTRDVDSWAKFLTGLDWNIINPLVKMATNSHVHPALAAGMVIRSTKDEDVKVKLVAHLERRAGNNEGGTSTGHPNEGTPAS